MALLVALAAGAAAGAGLWLVVRELVGGPPDLAAAQARMSGTDQAPSVDLTSTTTLKGKVGATVTARVQVPAIKFLDPSAADLDLTGTSPHEHLGEKVLGATVGVVLPMAAGVVLTSFGVRMHPVLFVAAGLGLLVVGWAAPDLDVTSRARSARDEMDRAVAALAELVAIQRLSGAGVAQSVKEAARAAESWPFQRVRAAIARGELNGQPPWDALDDLAAQLADPRHPERTQALRDLAAITRQAAQRGTQVADQLQGRARAMRGVQASADRAAANAASVTMTAPMSMTVIVVALAIVAPLAWQMLTR
ncbi:MAG: type II secretion system F family protein [Micrococcales bacterium]|nr:type II secretion system F family protein [Micrococcales bacterium]MCL2668318.1 type II secretion system F family protein [Micrococcales bacterium]